MCIYIYIYIIFKVINPLFLEINFLQLYVFSVVLICILHTKKIPPNIELCIKGLICELPDIFWCFNLHVLYNCVCRCVIVRVPLVCYCCCGVWQLQCVVVALVYCGFFAV